MASRRCRTTIEQTLLLEQFSICSNNFPLSAVQHYSKNSNFRTHNFVTTSTTTENRETRERKEMKILGQSFAIVPIQGENYNKKNKKSKNPYVTANTN